MVNYHMSLTSQIEEIHRELIDNDEIDKAYELLRKFSQINEDVDKIYSLLPSEALRGVDVDTNLEWRTGVYVIRNNYIEQKQEELIAEYHEVVGAIDGSGL